MPKLGSHRFAGLRPYGGHEGALQTQRPKTPEKTAEELRLQQLQRSAKVLGVVLSPEALRPQSCASSKQPVTSAISHHSLGRKTKVPVVHLVTGREARAELMKGLRRASGQVRFA